MLIPHITKLSIKQSWLCLPISIWSRSKKGACKFRPSKPRAAKPVSAKTPSAKTVCKFYMPKKAGAPKGTGATPGGEAGLTRALATGPCRMGFIPEEWFQFFYNMTGVTGPYFLMLGLANYAASKEIFVMEHEYYSGLSVLLVLYLISTKFGPQIGAALDKQVDAIHAKFQKVRDVELKHYSDVVKEAETAIIQAQGQKELMGAKKENILLQLEAEYRERIMKINRAVKNRMIYQVRKSRIWARMEQNWMVEWVIKHVHQSITPEFRKKALLSAIKDLDAMAAKIK